MYSASNCIPYNPKEFLRFCCGFDEDPYAAGYTPGQNQNDNAFNKIAKYCKRPKAFGEIARAC